jgi:hypothetical protein
LTIMFISFFVVVMFEDDVGGLILGHFSQVQLDLITLHRGDEISWIMG